MPEVNNDNSTDPMLQHFRWMHLPPHLQEVSRGFAHLAAQIVRTLPRNAERTVALRKLLEAKDCAVRSAIQQSDVKVTDLEDSTMSRVSEMLAPYTSDRSPPKESHIPDLLQVVLRQREEAILHTR